MKEIIKLPQHVINQIAAGEVVEGPYSIVKELIENSIDAHATLIKISVKDGGKKQIIVEDNGNGIQKEDLKIAFEPHTTSKIKNIEDLVNVSTLGFRGEALASIGSISNIEIISRHKNSNNAYTLKVEYGNIGEPEITNRAIGTTIIVNDIFQKIPARLKFLKTDQTEVKKIISYINKEALIRPTIRFIFTNNNRELFDYEPISLGITENNMTIHPERVKQVLGESVASDLIPINNTDPIITIGGFIGHPKTARENAYEPYLYVNNHPVWDRSIIKSIYNGTYRFVPNGSKIPFVIYIRTSGNNVDINVHPRKEEVRFINPYRIFASIEKTIKDALENFFRDENSYFEQSNESQQSDNAVYRLRSSFNASGNTNYYPKFHSNTNTKDISKSIQFTQFILNDNQPSLSQLKAQQYLNRYITIEKNNELWIVDQHAAAERIRFEALLKALNTKPLSQNLLVPVKMQLTQEEIIIISSLTEILTKIGFSLKTENNLLTITAIPQEISVYQPNTKEIIQEIINSSDNISNLESFLKEKYEDIIATVACHTSLRANQEITNFEAQKIIEKLFECKNPYSCPHGRPIIWKLTTDEIDSHFNRI